MARQRAQNTRRAPPPNRRRKRKPARREGGGPLFLVVFGLAFLVALFSWGFSLKDSSNAAAVMLLAEPSLPDPVQIDEDPLADADVIEGTLGKGETLKQSLKARGVAKDKVEEITSAMRDAFDFRITRAGDSYTLKQARKTGEILWFEYGRSALEVYRLYRDPEGRLTRFHKEALPAGQVVAVGSAVEGSLFSSLRALGETDALGVYLAEVFAFDLDLYEAAPGDNFRLLVEKSGEEPTRYGRILAAEYKRAGESFFAFWYVDPEGYGHYVNEKGAYLRKSFLRSPLKFVPLEGEGPVRDASSYRVPAGLPVVAVGEGEIVTLKEENEGFRLIVAHAGGYQTHYTQLSRLAPGIREGVIVNPHRILGYTGAEDQNGEGTLGFFLERAGERLDLPSFPLRTRSIPERHRAHFEIFLQEQLAALSTVAIKDSKEEAAQTTP